MVLLIYGINDGHILDAGIPKRESTCHTGRPCPDNKNPGAWWEGHCIVSSWLMEGGLEYGVIYRRRRGQLGQQAPFGVA
jgi:hypothetical protein